MKSAIEGRPNPRQTFAMAAFLTEADRSLAELRAAWSHGGSTYGSWRITWHSHLHHRAIPSTTLAANTRAISGSRALHRTVLWLHERLQFLPLAFWQPQRLGEFRQCFRSGAGREASEPHGLDMPLALGVIVAGLVGEAFDRQVRVATQCFLDCRLGLRRSGPEPRSSRRVRPRRICCSCRASGAPSL